MWLNFANISIDIFAKFIKAFWCYLFLKKGNEIKTHTHDL